MNIDELIIGRWARAYTNSLHLTNADVAPTFLGRVERVDEKAGRVHLRNEAGVMEIPAEYVVGHVTVIALVACSRSKLAVPAPAQDLYTGLLFRSARAWAEEYADQWLILSTQHGLVHPNIWLAPYDLALANMPADAQRRWAWRVFHQIRWRRESGRIPDPNHHETIFVFIGGVDYRNYLLTDLRAAGYGALAPLAGMGYGQQVAWLQARITAAKGETNHG